MADIAQIGFSADTSGLDAASTSLQRLVPASAAAEAGANKAAVALSNVGAAALGVSSATANTARVLQTATTGFSTQAANANKLSAAYQKLADIQSQINKATGVQSDPFANIGRAADIDAYGKAMDDLRAKYNPLFAAGQEYKATLQGINDALKVGAITQDEANDAVTNTKVAFVQQVEAIKGTNAQYVAFNNAAKGAAGATDNLAHSHAGLSTQAMAAQHSIRSLVEGLASGMPPSMVLTQQLNHLSFAASGPGGITQAFSDAIGMFTKLISASTLVGLGVAGIVIAFGALAIGAIKSEAALGDLSKATNITINDLRGLQQAASFKGVTSTDLETAITAIAKGTLDATHNMGELNGLFIANGVQVKGSVANLEAVADLVARTSDGVQKRNILEAAGLPTTTAFVKLMSQGGTAIQAIIDGTSKFNTAAENNLIKKAQDFEDAWNKASTNTSTFFHNLFVNAVLGINNLQQSIITFAAIAGAAIAIMLAPFSLIAAGIAALVAGGAALARIGGLGQTNTAPLGADGQPPKRIMITGGSTAADPNAGKPQPLTNAQMTDANNKQIASISALGDLATVQQQASAKQLELNNQVLAGTKITSDNQAKIVLATTAQAEQTRVNSQATAGIFDMQSAQKAASDTLQHWIDQGLVDQNNAQQMAAAHLVLARNIQATSDAAAVAAAPLQQLKQLELDGSNLAKSLDTATTSALNNLVQPIQDMMNGVTGLSAGFANLGVVVLQAIQQMIIKMLILTPIAKALQSVFSSLFPGFGLFSSAAAGPTSLGSAAGPSPLVANALGGVYNSPSLSAFSGQVVTQPTLFKFASGAGLMGEAGAEGILPLKRGPSGAMGVQMFGNGGSSNDNSATTTHVTYAPVYQVGGTASQKDIDDLKAAQQQSDREFASKVVGTIGNMRKHNVRV